MTEKHKQEAREIRLPFPCGCLDAHTGGGMTVQEHTCETHHAIALALSSRDKEIRDVLEGLRSENLSSEYECWCSFGRGFHTNACLAARGLWERVQG